MKWKDKITVDKVAEIIAGLGVPGLVLLVAMSVSGFAGAAATTTALAALGGPVGMLGGIAALGILAFIAQALSKYGIKTLGKRVCDILKKDMTPEEILDRIEKYPISEELRKILRDYIRS